MAIFRAINEILYNLMGPYFLLIPIAIYAIFKLISKDTAFPENEASFEKRAMAVFIDVGIVYIIFFILVFLNYHNSLYASLGLVAVSLSNMVILPTITGWSIGKKIIGLKIVKKNGKKAEFTDILYREIVKGWFSMPALFIGCMWMLISKNKLTWHDSIADTRIVYIEKKQIKEVVDAVEAQAVSE